MAKTTGSRPTPRVATSQGSNSWNTSSGSYRGASGTKAPTGSRPVPKVAKNTATPTAKPGAVKKPIKNTSMPRNHPPGDKARGSGNM